MFEWLLVAGLVAVIFIYFYELRFWPIVRADYGRSRGTLHKLTLTRARHKIGVEKKRLENKLSEIRDGIATQKSACDFEVRKAASRIVIQKFDPPGIGPKLRERILSGCYDGTLESLYRSHGVYGIGDQKYRAVAAWTSNAIAQLPEVISRGFPERGIIIERFRKELEKRELQQDHVQSQLSSCVALLEKLDEELVKIPRVNFLTFKKAIQGNEAAARAVTEYLKGAYPPWEYAPDWFNEASEYLAREE
jgi:hypothetical protein